jgi:hypothetical protein
MYRRGSMRPDRDAGKHGARLLMRHAWKGFGGGYISHGEMKGDRKGLDC